MGLGIRGRMRVLNAKLLHLRLGPGAAILPPNIKRINLDFAVDWNNGHLGPRRFWRKCLPRLKYHNPMVAMSVQRTKDQTSKPIMTIHYEDSTTKTIDMQMKMETEILQEFMKTTNATEVQPTQEEVQELEEIRLQQIEIEKDRIRVKEYTDKQKEDKRLLAQARQMID